MTKALNSENKEATPAKRTAQLALPYDILVATVVFSDSFHAYEKVSDRISRESNLTSSQFTTLWCMLLLNKPLQPTEISRFLGIETSSVTSLLDFLEKRELVNRNRVKHDRRVVEITLTPKGKRLITQVIPKMRQSLIEIFGVFSEEELSQFIGLLQKIRQVSRPVNSEERYHLEDYYTSLFSQLLQIPGAVKVPHNLRAITSRRIVK